MRPQRRAARALVMAVVTFVIVGIAAWVSLSVFGRESRQGGAVVGAVVVAMLCTAAAVGRGRGPDGPTS